MARGRAICRRRARRKPIGRAAAAGLSRMMEMVNGSRFGVALMGLGIHRRSFLEARDLRRAPRAVGSAHRPVPARPRDARRPARRARGRLPRSRSSARPRRRTAADEDEGRRLRRILVPLAKIRATREAITAASQALEVFGGNGYMEDWPMARQLRDAQCHTIWEGTENILCLDVRRAMQHDAGARGAARPGRTRARRRPRRRRRSRPRVDAVARDARPTRAPRPSTSIEAADRAAAAARPAVLVPARRPDRRRAASSTRRRGCSSATATPARRSWPAGSRDRRLVPPRVRGILDDDRTVLDLFEPIVRYGRDRAEPRPREPDAARPPSGASRPRWSTALDEQLGPPVDGYVNGTQTWLTDDGPAGRPLEWRLHPVAVVPPAGRLLATTTSGSPWSAGSPPAPTRRRCRSATSAARSRRCGTGSSASPSTARHSNRRRSRRRRPPRSASPPDAAGLVDHERIGDAWERSRGAVSIVALLLEELTVDAASVRPERPGRRQRREP